MNIGAAKSVTATEAKNRLGQVLEQAQIRPVFIEKAGRPHSVVLSIGRYESLLAKAGEPEKSTSAAHFYERYKDFVDEQNRHFEAHGLWNDDLRTW